VSNLLTNAFFIEQRNTRLLDFLARFPKSSLGTPFQGFEVSPHRSLNQFGGGP